MPILLKTSPQNLKIGTKYFIDVKWNLTNNLRINAPLMYFMKY